MQNFLSKYIQGVLLVLGMLLLIIGVAFTWGFFIAVMLAGLLMIVLAFLINYERSEG
ncbi:hypothetical protein FD00_GL000005 [Liquorilactobacillus mali KCTC 3596 = DSM 20444]|uniref:Uncharacterized protein n=1 Tax=Liquorilactobacillus mali KCTC 3596 = DSM 20444 TaxID=1046596 RepID=A0A0R2E6Y5_9LACO|nr:hypothetical protein [Liquorilactobacillus mali]KRN11475.1 hypothetical protein FD00_GL000005 [Liquorilactobacillus mali KCTC 3596 = DSM 20444]